MHPQWKRIARLTTHYLRSGVKRMGATAVPACKTRIHLRRACSVAVSDYTRAVRVLRERSGQMSAQNSELLRSYVAKTRKLAEQARTALNKHLVEHGCSTPEDNRRFFTERLNPPCP
jgi:type II secretory pathway component PulC